MNDKFKKTMDKLKKFAANIPSDDKMKVGYVFSGLGGVFGGINVKYRIVAIEKYGENYMYRCINNAGFGWF